MTNLPNPDEPISRRLAIQASLALLASCFLYGCTTDTNPQARKNIKETATAIAGAGKTAEQILTENHAPPEVASHAVQLTLRFSDGSASCSGTVVEILTIADKKYALIATAGHSFYNTENNNIRALESASLTPSAKVKPQTPDQSNLKIAAADSTYSKLGRVPDFALLLVEVSSDYNPTPLQIVSKLPNPATDKLFGLGFPGSDSLPAPIFQKIPYISLSNQFTVDRSSRKIYMKSSNSQGASGTGILTQNGELAAIITNRTNDSASESICTLIPEDYLDRKLRVITNFLKKTK